MRKMRKMLGVALVLLLCLGVVGCTTQEASSTTPEGSKTHGDCRNDSGKTRADKKRELARIQ